MTGIIESIIYVLICFIVVGVICSITRNDFLTRKILHMLMASWWFVFLNNIESEIIIIGPLSFIVINYLYSKLCNKHEYGMVHFAISLSILAIVSRFNEILILPATAGMMILGYADPVAALVGRAYQKYKGYETHTKSIVGSIAFSIVAMIILLVLIDEDGKQRIGFDLIILGGFFAYIENRVFPKYDNMLIPIAVFIFVYMRGLIWG